MSVVIFLTVVKIMLQLLPRREFGGFYRGVIEDSRPLGYGAVSLGSRSVNNISWNLDIWKIRATALLTCQATSTDTASNRRRPGNSPSRITEYNRHFALIYNLLRLET
jgi:hypothetical protein